MSRTLNAILKHWNGDILEQGESVGFRDVKKIELPFNLEKFCQEMDEDLACFDNIKQLLKENGIDLNEKT
jgi:hypothetical protein